MPDPEPDLNPLCDADPLARALANLRPAPAAVDPHRVAFLAGQARRDATVTFWRRAFLAQCVVLAVVGCLATLHFVRLAELDNHAAPSPAPLGSSPAPVPEPAPMPRAAPEAYPGPPPQFAGPRPETDTEELAEYFRVRREVLAAGLGLLPESTARPLPPVSPTELEKSLQLPPGVLAYPFAAPPRPKAPPEPDPDSPE